MLLERSSSTYKEPEFFFLEFAVIVHLVYFLRNLNGTITMFKVLNRTVDIGYQHGKKKKQKKNPYLIDHVFYLI